MAKLGSVYHWSNYKFSDGTLKDKYFVILSTAKAAQMNYLFALTTSQQKRNNPINGPSCGLPTYSSYAIAGKVSNFRKDTWVKLNEIYMIGYSVLMDKTISKEISHCFDLHIDITKSILRCAQKSIDISGADLQRLKAHI